MNFITTVFIYDCHESVELFYNLLDGLIFVSQFYECSGVSFVK